MANLTGAYAVFHNQLLQAASLEGATMPNGLDAFGVC